MTDIPSLVESVPMDHVIDRTASEGVQLAQAEGWIRQLMASYQSIQQTCANKDAAITRLRAELETERRKVEVATWKPFDPMDPPPIRLSVIVRAKLAGEDVFASHEAFWNGRRMCSVRSDEENYWLKFSEVSHILEMPNCDAALTPSEKGEV